MATDYARTIRFDDFIGGVRMPDENADHKIGVGVHVFLCPHCDAKHLAISRARISNQPTQGDIHG